MVSCGNCHAADELGKARQGTASGIAPPSPAGVEMRYIVSAAWCDAPVRIRTTYSNSADRNGPRASIMRAPSMCSTHLSAAWSVRTVKRVPLT